MGTSITSEHVLSSSPSSFPFSPPALPGIGKGNVISDYTVVKAHFKLTTGHQKWRTLHRGRGGGVDGVSGQVRNGEGLWRKDLIRWKGEIREGIINGAWALWSRRFVWSRMQNCVQDNRGGGGKKWFPHLSHSLKLEDMRIRTEYFVVTLSPKSFQSKHTMWGGLMKFKESTLNW